MAAIAALHLAAGKTSATSTEWAGAILETPQGYVFTSPQSGSESNFSLKFEIPAGDKLVALYHTHPNFNDSTTGDDQFSPMDVQVANQLHVPSFIWVQRNQHVLEFIPGRSFVSDCGGGFGSSDDGCSSGQMVGRV